MKANQLVAIKGRLVNDPEVKTSEGGKKYFKIGLAVNEKLRNAEGNVEEVTTFYNLLAFDKAAEIYSNVKKGQYVRAEGRLQIKPYLSKESEPKVDCTVILDDLMVSLFIGGDENSSEEKEEKAE
ncbi:MAG: single-stranded DNA-binding protein [bacterium]